MRCLRLPCLFMLCLMLLVPAMAGQQAPFEPAQLAEIRQATLYMNLQAQGLPNSGTYVRTLTNPDKLSALAALLSGAELMDHGSGCGFEMDLAFLLLDTKDGRQFRLLPAPDSCTVYKIDGRYFNFMPKVYRNKPEHPNNRILYDLFDPADPQVTESSDAKAEFERLLLVVKSQRHAISPIWGDPIINTAVWDALAASPHLHKTEEELKQAFGEHPAFWPIEIKLLYSLRTMKAPPPNNTVPSLPYFRDMQAEEALALAQKEMEACEAITPQVKARLLPDISFTYNEQEMAESWHILFRDPADPELAVLYSVVIDQKTRQVLESIGPEGNG